MGSLDIVRRGTGEPLVLVHGLGGSWQSWETILDRLAAEREVIAISLPGHGASPPRRDSDRFAGLADSVAGFLVDTGLDKADLVGSSMGARLVLEMARRGLGGAVVALDPGGFWRGWERTYFRATIGASARLLRAIEPALRALSRSAVGRILLLAQLSARPTTLDGDAVGRELTSYVRTPTFDGLVRDLAAGPEQIGPAANRGPVTIVWGRQDRLCLPRQARRAQSAFPSAELVWFEDCGHFPHWDQPEQTARVILERTCRAPVKASS